jgi:hypothetical protein
MGITGGAVKKRFRQPGHGSCPFPSNRFVWCRVAAISAWISTVWWSAAEFNASQTLNDRVWAFINCGRPAAIVAIKIRYAVFMA